MLKLNIQSNKRNEMINITSDIEKIVEKEKIERGFLIIYIPHTTVGITINEGADPSVQYDILKTLNIMIPKMEIIIIWKVTAMLILKQVSLGLL